MGAFTVLDGGASPLGACTTPGSTRACCGAGTQTCIGAQEVASYWGPCVDPSGTALQCSGPGGGGGEDSGAPDAASGPGTGGGGSEDGGGIGPGGGGGEDGGGIGPGGGGGEDGGGIGPGGGGGEDGGGIGPGGGGVEMNPPPTPTCSNLSVNTEPQILVAYSPATGQSVGPTGMIKVWVADESPPIIAPGEQPDPNTGAIVTPGDRTALAPDGYPWEPTLYIGGKAYYPNAIKGLYNSASTGRGAAMVSAPVDPTPSGYKSPLPFTAEDIWDVSSLGLSPGTYAATFVVHDGDRDRGVGCVIIVIS